MRVFQKVSGIAAVSAMIFSSSAMAAPVSAPVRHGAYVDTSAIAWSEASDSAEGWRSYRPYRGYRGYRHRDRIDGGDVLAGILIIGGIAAIAGAASKNARDRRYDDRRYDDRSNPSRYPDQRPDQRYEDRDTRYDSRSDTDARNDPAMGSAGVGAGAEGSSAMQAAIGACAEAAERRAGANARVETIDTVARDGNGWRVEGSLSGGTQRFFSCGSTAGQADFVQLGNESFARRL